MNSPFILTNSKKNIFTVSWPTFGDIRGLDAALKLMHVLFGDLKIFDKVGLVVKYNIEEVSVLWINSELFYLKDASAMDNYIHDYYDIVGVSFISEKDAIKFKEWLEKKLVWQLLAT